MNSRSRVRGDAVPKAAPPSYARAVSSATASTVLAMVPVFLVGSMAGIIRVDLESFDEVRVGLATSSFFAASAASSVLAGRRLDRTGPGRGAVAAIAVGLSAMLGLGVAPNVLWLGVACALAGAANGVAQPAANLGLAWSVRSPRRGRAFGVKQAAVPIAGLLAGVAVPLLGLLIGWRWTFVLIGVVGSMVVMSLVPPAWYTSQVRPTSAPGGYGSRRSLLLIATGAGFASAASNSLGAFLVLSATTSGLSPVAAGYLLALGSVAGIATRLVLGWLADRRFKHLLTVVAVMLGLGTAGFGLLGMGGTRPVILIGTLIAFVAGWGWPGLLILAVVRLHPAGPAASTGLLGAGTAVGGIAGPLLFGLIAGRHSFALAWIGAGGCLLVAAAFVLCGQVVVRQNTHPPWNA